MSEIKITLTPERLKDARKAASAQAFVSIGKLRIALRRVLAYIGTLTDGDAARAGGLAFLVGAALEGSDALRPNKPLSDAMIRIAKDTANGKPNVAKIEPLKKGEISALQPFVDVAVKFAEDNGVC